MYFLYFQHTISSQSEHSFCSKLIINSSAPSWCNHTKNYVLELFLFQWKNYWLAPMSQSLCPITRATKTGLHVPDHTRSSWWSHERDKRVLSRMGGGAPTNITGACIAKPVSYLIIFISFYSLLKEFTYLFLERRGEKEKERERNIDVREKHHSVASHKRPDGGLNLHLRPVPWRGTEPGTSRLAGRRLTHWDISVKAFLIIFNNTINLLL